MRDSHVAPRPRRGELVSVSWVDKRGQGQEVEQRPGKRRPWEQGPALQAAWASAAAVHVHCYCGLEVWPVKESSRNLLWWKEAASSLVYNMKRYKVV